MTRTPALLASGLAASLILAFAPAAHADTIPISLGARIGYGIPSGESTKNATMRDGIGGVILVQLDAMYSLGFGLRLGLYGSSAGRGPHRQLLAEDLRVVPDVHGEPGVHMDRLDPTGDRVA